MARCRTASYSLALLLLSAFACAKEAPPSPQGTSPRIAVFEVGPNEVLPGESVTIQWKTENVTSLRLLANGEAIDLVDVDPTEDSYVHQPVENTEYVLEASDEQGESVTASAEVVVHHELRIARFQADPTTIEKGKESKLSWEAPGATSIRITAEEGDTFSFEQEGSAGVLPVRPNVTTTYLLVAQDPLDRQAEARLTVTVRDEGATAEFRAEPPIAEAGEEVTLYWQVEGARTVRLVDPEGSQLHQSNEATGSFRLQPEVTTTYTLLVNEGDDDALELQVTSRIQPVIDDFFLTEPERLVRPGTPVEVQWRTRAATKLILGDLADQSLTIPSDEIASGAASLPVGPYRTFRLRAESGDLFHEAFIQVPVTDGPLIHALQVGPEVSAGRGFDATVEVEWRSEGATELRLEALPGGEIPIGSASLDEGKIEVEISGPTLFQLHATNAAGHVFVEAEAPVVLPAHIEHFDALPARVGSGDTVLLQWETLDATALRLELEDSPLETDPLSATDSHEEVLVDPGKHRFRLVAENRLGHLVHEDVVVEVGAPAIAEFGVDRLRVPTGYPITFHWKSLGGRLLRVVEDASGEEFCRSTDLERIGEGSCSGNAPTSEADFTYRLIVENGSGEDEETLVLTVVDRPMIDEFDVEPKVIEQHQTLTFSWVVRDDASGETVSLTLEDQHGKSYPLGNAHPNFGILELPMDEPGEFTFTLRAATSGTVNPDEFETHAIVHGLPVFDSVSAPEVVEAPGEPATLSWKTRYASVLEVYALDAEGAPIGDPLFIAPTQADRDEGQFEVYPDAVSRTFRIVLRNPMGSEESHDRFIDIGPITVEDFYANRVEILEGEEVTFTWLTKSAEHAYLYWGRGAFEDIRTDGGPVQVLPFPGTRLNSFIVPTTFPDGFAFPFDGRHWSKGYVSTAGFLSFDPSAGTGQVTALPNPSGSDRRSHLVPYGYTLHARKAGIDKLHQAVRTHPEFGRYYVLQWSDWDVSRLSVDASLHFQVLLWEEDGAFEFRYGPMTKPETRNFEYSNGRDAAIGWQNLAGDDGVEYWSRGIGRMPTDMEGLAIMGPSREGFPREALPPSGHWTTHPSHSATYTLRVWNDFNVEERSIDVRVYPRAELEAEWEPTWPEPGQPITLRWNGVGLQRLVIENASGTPIHTTTDPAQLRSGTFTLPPQLEGEQRITVRGIGQIARDVVERELRIPVFPEFRIDDFHASTDLLDLPGSLNLHWMTTNASTFAIEAFPGGPIDVAELDPASGSVTVHPLETTTYRLTIGNYGSEKHEEITVRVRDARIDDLQPSEAFLQIGEPLTLSWQSSGAGTIRIEPERAWLVLHEVDSAFVDLSLRESSTVSPWEGDADTGRSTIAFPAGFTFPWFGDDYASIVATADGFLSFDPADAASGEKTRMPSFLIPSSIAIPQKPAFALLWQDLDGKATGEMRHEFFTDPVDASGDHLIIQWSHWQFADAAQNGAGADLNFQIVLFRDGSFEYRYGVMQSAGSQEHADGKDASIGFQAPTYDRGFQLGWEEPIEGGLSNRSWRFEHPRLDANGSLTFAPQRSEEIRVCIDSPLGEDCRSTQVHVLQPGDLLITELMLDPAGSAQWFEVRNTSAGLVDLDGMDLDLYGQPHRIQAGGPLLVQPGQYAVLSQAPFAGLPTDVPHYVYGPLALHRTTGSIEISKEGMVVAQMSWSDNQVRGSSVELDPSRQRPGRVEGQSFQYFHPTTDFYDGQNRGTPGRHARIDGPYGIDPFSAKGPIDIDGIARAYTGIGVNLTDERIMPGHDPKLYDDRSLGISVAVHGYASILPPVGSKTITSSLSSGTGTVSAGVFAPFGMSLESKPRTNTPPSLPISYRWAELVIDGQHVWVTEWHNSIVTYQMENGYVSYQLQVWENGEVVFHYFDMAGHDTYFGGRSAIGIREANQGTAGTFRYLEYSYGERSLRPGQTIHFWPQP